MERTVTLRCDAFERGTVVLCEGDEVTISGPGASGAFIVALKTPVHIFVDAIGGLPLPPPAPEGPLRRIARKLSGEPRKKTVWRRAHLVLRSTGHIQRLAVDEGGQVTINGGRVTVYPQEALILPLRIEVESITLAGRVPDHG